MAARSWLAVSHQRRAGQRGCRRPITGRKRHGHVQRGEFSLRASNRFGSMLDYALIALEAVIATRPRVSSSAMLSQAELVDAAGAKQRVRVVVPRWNREFEDVTRGSRILIGGDFGTGGRAYIIPRVGTVLSRAPHEEDAERASPRVQHETWCVRVQARGWPSRRPRSRNDP